VLFLFAAPRGRLRFQLSSANSIATGHSRSKLVPLGLRLHRDAKSTQIHLPPFAARPIQALGRSGMKNILDFARARRDGRPIVVVAAYDALMARLLATSEVDAILVGDSVAMVVHGFPSTVHATVEMMCAHTAAVRRGAPEMLIVADMPFLSARSGWIEAVRAAGALLQAGATAVKLEGVTGHEDVITHLIGTGIPVMGHLGLTPQSVHQLGGYRVQGRTPEAAERLRAEARRLELLGAFATVLECVPAALAAEISRASSIPTIGIGAGLETHRSSCCPTSWGSTRSFGPALRGVIWTVPARFWQRSTALPGTCGRRVFRRRKRCCSDARFHPIGGME
jgi:3-methyl-2-oxobutanoate hydroxymethyltransferase